jgi:quercetin dioxygenase-like cupin family protein
MTITQTAPRTEVEFLGARARILATGEETNGTLGLVEMVDVPAGDMPPLHVHHSADESFYVLEGTVSFFLPGREIELEPGDFLFAPRRLPHAYRVGEEPARLLVTSTPSGFERFVAAAWALGEADPATLGALAAEHDIEILGPPGMLP